MPRLTEPTKSTRVYLRKRDKLHKRLRKEIRDERKANRENRAALKEAAE